MRLLTTLFLLTLLALPAVGQTTYTSPDTGERPLGTYSFGNMDSVSLTNGNLHLRIPVYSLPGRELPRQLTMDYNSQFLEYVTGYDEFGQPITPGWEFLGWRQDSGIGGRLTAYRIQISGYPALYRSYNAYFWWIDGLGTKHPFPPTQIVQNCSNTLYSDAD